MNRNLSATWQTGLVSISLAIPIIMTGCGGNGLSAPQPAVNPVPRITSISPTSDLTLPGPIVSATPGQICPSGGCALTLPAKRLQSPGTITTVAGGSLLCESRYNQVGDGCLATSAFLATPAGTAVDGNGNLFIADEAHNRIRVVNQQASAIVWAGVKIEPGHIGTIAGNGNQGYTGDNGPAGSAKLSSPTYVTVDTIGNLYIADFGNNVIRAVNMQSLPITMFGIVVRPGDIATIAGGGSGCPQQTDALGDGCPATNSILSRPEGQRFDGAGNLYIPDVYNNRVRKVDATTGVITTVVGNGFQGFSGDGGLAKDAELFGPTCVALDAEGNLYVADYYNNRVRKVDATGTITTVAGTGNVGYSGDGGPPTSANLDGPISVAVDGTGNLYIAAFNERIRVVNMQSQPITVAGVVIQPATIATIAGNGSIGYTGDDGPATYASLDGPTGLFVSAAGDLYFADSVNNVVRKIQLGTAGHQAGSFTWPVDPSNPNDGFYGSCAADWPGDPQGCYWISSNGWRDVQPFQKLSFRIPLSPGCGLELRLR